MAPQSATGNFRHKGGGRTKRLANEGEPVVAVKVVAEPVEVRVALGIVPPDVADQPPALESIVRNVAYATAHRRMLPISELNRIRDQKSPNISHRVSSFFGKRNMHTRERLLPAAILAHSVSEFGLQKHVTAGILA